MTLETIYSILDKVLKDKVFYAVNVYDNEENVPMPYIVYQEITKKPKGYHDDVPIFYVSSVQITLVTKKKDLTLEGTLEKALLKNGFSFSVLSETHNSDKSINRVYEIEMEDF